MQKKYLKNFTGRLIITAFFAVLQIIMFILTILVLSSYAIVINTILTVISLIVVIIVMNQPKNPSYKLTWTILILTFPLFGGLMYLAASLQSSTYRFRRKSETAHATVIPYMKQNPAITAALRKESRTKAAHAAYLANTVNFPLYDNTAVTYFPSGETKFAALTKELAAAKRFIFMEYFIIQEGVMWDAILKILVEKVREGVEVRLIWDGMGCMTTLPKNYDKTLESLGIRVMIFSPFVPLATVIQNNRDHRKIVVIDGHTAFTGGINLADEYINVYERFGHWKDAAVMLHGDAVRSFTMIFLETWYMENPIDKDIAKYLFPFPDTDSLLLSSPIPSDTETGSSVLSGTETGSPVLSGTETGSSVLSDTETGSSVLSGTETGSSVLSGTETGSPVLSGTETGSPIASEAGTETSVPPNAGTGTSVPSGATTGSPVLSGAETGESVLSDTETGAHEQKPPLGYVQPYADTPLDGECVGELVYFNLINKAKEYIYITTPYLIPDNELMTALCFAAKSGIDVRIITPGIPDKRYVYYMTRSFYGQLLESGVKIYEYTPGFLHQKICVSDDSIAVVGSINFDYRSLYLHFECAALCYDNPVIYDVKRDFCGIMKESQEITPEIYRKIRHRSGFIMSFLRIFAPLF